MPDDVSNRVVEQRVRNLVIDTLELTASYEQQREYQRRVPFVYVPSEVLDQWEDDFFVDPRTTPDLPGVYSPDEVEAICRFHAVWEATTLPDDYPELVVVHAMPEWDRLRRAAAEALAVFLRRGRLSGDHEKY